MSYSLIHGDCREVLQQFKDNTIDALGTEARIEYWSKQK